MKIIWVALRLVSPARPRRAACRLKTAAAAAGGARDTGQPPSCPPTTHSSPMHPSPERLKARSGDGSVAACGKGGPSSFDLIRRAFLSASEQFFFKDLNNDIIRNQSCISVALRPSGNSSNPSQGTPRILVLNRSLQRYSIDQTWHNVS
jgi:hypothetical protein